MRYRMPKLPQVYITHKRMHAFLNFIVISPVLRMLSDYVGEEKFLKGVSLYLKKNLFANSVTHDLWEGISTATGLDITQLMENWITKIGFPVLTVTEDARGIIVRQGRFLETGSTDPKDNETIWFISLPTFIFHSMAQFSPSCRNIPLSLLSTKNGKSSVDKTAILQARETTIPLDTSQPFKLNAGTTGVCASFLLFALTLSLKKIHRPRIVHP